LCVRVKITAGLGFESQRARSFSSSLFASISPLTNEYRRDILTTLLLPARRGYAHLSGVACALTYNEDTSA
jgi:hypothetical protein